MALKCNYKKQLLVNVLLSTFLTAGAVIAHECVAPKQFGKIKNPMPSTSESVAKGRELFLDYGATCHGNNGLGLSAKEAGLKKKSPNLVKRHTTHSDGDFF